MKYPERMFQYSFIDVLAAIMKKYTIIIFALLFLSELTFGQNKQAILEYNELLNYKTDTNRFDFGWLDNVFSGIPCYRDYTDDDTQMQLIDPKTDSIIYISTEQEKIGLKIRPEKISIDTSRNQLHIRGEITGSWESVIPNEFKIYIGHRIDTVSYTNLSPSLHGDVFYNGVKVKSTIIIDTVPAFYLVDFKSFTAYRGDKNIKNSEFKEMHFDIESVIDERSILVFGLSSRYAEIFEIGNLLKNIKSCQHKNKLHQKRSLFELLYIVKKRLSFRKQIK